jgi:hypothetical protein
VVKGRRKRNCCLAVLRHDKTTMAVALYSTDRRHKLHTGMSHVPFFLSACTAVVSDHTHAHHHTLPLRVRSKILSFLRSPESYGHLGTDVVSDHTHARPLYTSTPPHATVTREIKDLVLLEITRILRFRRRRTRHIPFVAPCVRANERRQLGNYCSR